MDSAKPHSLGSLATRLACTLGGLLLLYVLGSGPSFYLSERWPQTLPVVARLYGPLSAVILPTPLEDPYQAYIGWWGRLALDHSQEMPPQTPP